LDAKSLVPVQKSEEHNKEQNNDKTQTQVVDPLIDVFRTNLSQNIEVTSHRSFASLSNLLGEESFVQISQRRTRKFFPHGPLTVFAAVEIAYFL
jgi:hypothetical protein